MLISQLNHVYRPLENKLLELQSALANLPYKLRSGWFNGHYYRNCEGIWTRNAFPLPEVDVVNLCDIEIHFDHICITTKLHRKEALEYRFDVLSKYKFEVYGVKNYLLDFYREGLSRENIVYSILQSNEDEIGFSFILPLEGSIDHILSLVYLLHQEGFHY